MFKKSVTLLSFLVILIACKKTGSQQTTTAATDSTALPGSKTAWWQPAAQLSFDWDLDDIKSSDTFSGAVVDVDAFTTTAEMVAALHAKGKKVIAYLSVGTLENDRPDSNLLPQDVIGNVYDDWPDEKWLDIRQIDKLKPWLNSRFSMIIQKGFDGVEPDNMDGYDNETVFDIKISDAKLYADYLIALAHKNGLSIGQKNIEELTNDYVTKFDWALTEDAFQQGWENSMVGYIKLNKPVFSVEYTDVTSQSTFENKVCPEAASLGFTAILKKRNLNKWVYKCQ